MYLWTVKNSTLEAKGPQVSENLATGRTRNESSKSAYADDYCTLKLNGQRFCQLQCIMMLRYSNTNFARIFPAEVLAIVV
jgi:hypothetical protein